MRSTVVTVAIVIALAVVCLLSVFAGPDVLAEDAPARVLRHVVLFQFKDTATPEQIRGVESAFCGLPAATGLIVDFEWGTNVSPENLNAGLTHCFFVTFKSEEDRDAYLPHPAHKAFVELLGPCLEKAVVVDYWTKP